MTEEKLKASKPTRGKNDKTVNCHETLISLVHFNICIKCIMSSLLSKTN